MALRDTFLNMLGVSAPEVPKTDNSVFKSARDFLRYGNREKLYPDWSDVKMPDSDMYRGYSYAVIQKRSNKVATLAKNNLSTWAKPEVVDAFQDKDETVLHPYLKLIEDSTEFSEKQFWKNISIYLDLAGRYYLGVIRNQIVPSNPNLPVITTDATRFVLLNPYEIRRVIDKDKNVAGYIERKKDGRYREWPKHQIIEMRELNPFDPENSQWAMTDAAKEAVYTINQSSDYTRQSLHGNIEAPGIITTDVLLSDQDFANFRARVTQHQKGEPLFGNGTGAIKWDAMQIDLDKAALMDINEINRTTLFAVSGTSKTSLGIEQSGTTRETARVQSEQFIADTAQPRLEDIVDFLNLDYKKNYFNEYKKTGYYIEVKSAVGRDYDTEQKATALKQSQFQLAMQLMQAGYTEQSAYQFAEGEIDFGDLELEKGLDKPQNPENPSEGEGSDENSPNSPKNGPQSGSGAGDDNNTTSEQNSLETAENEVQDDNPEVADLNELEPHSDLVENKTSEGEKRLPLISNGGKGSGNFGHSGRPGEVGGSSKGLSGIESLEKSGVKIWDAEKEFFAQYPKEIEAISKVVDEYRKMGLKMEFKLTANRGMVADNLDDLVSTAYVGRTVTNDEYDSTVFISRDLFEKGERERKAYKYKEGEKQPVCTDDTLTGVMRHELGHLFATQLWLKESGHKGEIHDRTDYDRFNSKLLKQSGASKPYDMVSGKRGKWSQYAEVNDTEAIAEAFSNPNFSSDTKKVYDYVKKYKPEKNKNEVEKNSGALVACVGYPDSEEFLVEVRKYLQANNHCTCEHDHKVEHFINEIQPEEGKEVKEAYDEFLTEIRALEKETINAVARKLTTNAFDESDIIGKRKKATITDKIKNAIRKYWWLLLPLFANNGMSKRNKEFGENIIFTFDNALQNKVINNADRVAKGHMDTILNDILEASNKVYTDILEGAAADLVVTAYRDNPEKFSAYFDHEPTRADALASIRKTDLLEQNRRIYDRANKMAFEGYERGKIVKAVRAEYKDISENRATLIARNETARAFGKSQFEADRQFLNAVGKLGQAYKIWYSRRPAGEQDKICPFCRELIEQSNINPVPFDKPFVEYGNSLEVIEDGKVKIFTADYEDIEGGTLHPNCSCGYKLVFKNAQGEFVKTLNGGSGSGNFGHAGRPGEVGGSGKGTNAREQFNKLKEITNWTDAELHSVIPYFGSFENTAKVQEYLRGGDDSALTPYVITSDCANTMKRKMEQTTFPEDTTLYRGMMIRNDRMERVEKNGFSYPGFQSTTLVGNDASRIIQEYRDSGNYDKQFYTPVLLKINAKKGGHFASSYTDGEHEIVLPDNVEFKVKNKKPTSWGAVIYEVDYE